MNENDLLNKLAISKKIMDKHNATQRNTNTQTYNYDTDVKEFDVPQAKFNIPQEYMMEAQTPIRQNNEVPTKDRILNSKLPDEIKRLMIEHPIAQPNSMGGGSILSNDLIEKASRLMKNDVANNKSPFQGKTQPVQESSRPQNVTSNIDKNMLKDMIKETIEEVLGENGLLVESTSKSNDVFQFRVGSHIFEGKVTRIKKVK
jgi:hypothetical protein